MGFGKHLGELVGESGHLLLEGLTIILGLGNADIATGSKNVILLSNVVKSGHCTESLLILQSAFHILVICSGNLHDIFFCKLAEATGNHRTHIAGIDKQCLAWLFLCSVQEPQRHRNTSGIEELARKSNNALYKVCLENILKADLVECIVALPSQLFYSTGIPVSLWFLNRAKKQPGKTLFIDARNMGTMVTRRLRELTEEDIMKIAGTYDKYVEGTLEDEKGFCAVATLDDIAKQDYILTPGRYVGIAETEDDGEPFEEKMTRLTNELSEMFAKSHELETEIRKQLASIGFELK